MSTRHHPDYNQLLAFSAGSIDPSIGLCIGVHLEYCEYCRQQLARMDILGGILFEQLSPEPVDNTLLDNIFDRIDQKSSSSAGQASVYTRHNNLPDAINKLTGYDLDTLHWRKHGHNVKTATLLEHQGLKASLIHLKAGARIPSHHHRGNEYTVVLTGSFSDQDGCYQQGDFLLRSIGESHTPTATRDQDCICLAVIDAPLRFRNPLMELVNRLAPI